jgi:hypothetical protein
MRAIPRQGAAAAYPRIVTLAGTAGTVAFPWTVPRLGLAACEGAAKAAAGTGQPGRARRPRRTGHRGYARVGSRRGRGGSVTAL